MRIMLFISILLNIKSQADNQHGSGFIKTGVLCFQAMPSATKNLPPQIKKPRSKPGLQGRLDNKPHNVVISFGYPISL